jgi:UDP-2,3-diacylglucosamine hydrolase
VKRTTERVLTTSLFAADDDDRLHTVILSDLHVSVEGGSVLDDFCLLLQRVRDAAPRATRVLVLGDLFDVYVGRGQLEVGSWRHLAEQLRRTAAAGASITLLHGNRDFMLDASAGERLGCRVVAGGLVFHLDGARVLALHGDELCLNDVPYQRSKRWLRHPMSKGVLRNLPLPWAMALGRGARRKSMATTQRGDSHRFEPVEEAVLAALAVAPTLIFGHIHNPAHGSLAHGQYFVLPAFDASPIYLEHGPGMPLAYRSLRGHGVAFPPRAFAAVYARTSRPR